MYKNVVYLNFLQNLQNYDYKKMIKKFYFIFIDFNSLWIGQI